MTRKTLACFAVILLASFAFGQNSQSFAVVDNTPNCISTGAFSCWTMLPNPVGFINAATGTADFTIYAVDNTTQVYQLLLNPTSWQRNAGLGGAQKVAVQDANDIYALLTNNGGCASGDHIIAKANSGLTAWSQWGQCAIGLSVSADQTVGIVLTNGTAKVHRATDTSPFWVTITGTGWSDITVLSNATAYGRQTGTLYKINITNNTVSTISGLTVPGTPPPGQMAVDVSNKLWVLGPLVNNSNVYVQDMNAMSGWVRWNGWRGFISAGTNVVAQGSTGNYTAYALIQTAPQLTTTTTFDGSYPSTDLIANISSAHVVANGLNGTLGAHSQVNSGGNVHSTSNATETAPLCDPIFGDGGSDSCAFDVHASAWWAPNQGGGNAPICSFTPVDNYGDCTYNGIEMGLVFPKISNGPTEWKLAITKSGWNGNSIGLPSFNTGCDVFDYCAAGTGPKGNPPLAHFSLVIQSPWTPTGPARSCMNYYVSWAECGRMKLGGVWSPWTCQTDPIADAFGLSSFGTNDSTLGSCTGPPSYWNSLP